MFRKLRIQKTRPDPNRVLEKSLIVLMIGFFLLGMATKAEVEDVKEEAKKEVVKSETNPEKGTYELLIKPSEEPSLYKTSLNIETPNEGIASGHVIAYGHYIKPPYKVEIKEDTILFINGVQLFPHLASKFEIEKKRREEISLEEYQKNHIKEELLVKRIHSLFDKIGETYKVIEPKNGRNKAIDSIFKLAQAETLVVKTDTTTIGKDDCTFYVDYFIPGYGDTTGFMLLLHGGDPSSGYTSKSREIRDSDDGEKYVNYWKKRIEEELREGDVIFRSSFMGNKSGVNSWKGYFFWRILDILENEGLTIEEKIGEIKSEVPLPFAESIKELIYNFDPSEWPTKNKKE